MRPNGQGMQGGNSSQPGGRVTRPQVDFMQCWGGCGWRVNPRRHGLSASVAMTGGRLSQLDSVSEDLASTFSSRVVGGQIGSGPRLFLQSGRGAPLVSPGHHHNSGIVAIPTSTFLSAQILHSLHHHHARRPFANRSATTLVFRGLLHSRLLLACHE
jgi:hypothetical protein